MVRSAPISNLGMSKFDSQTIGVARTRCSRNRIRRRHDCLENPKLAFHTISLSIFRWKRINRTTTQWFYEVLLFQNSCKFLMLERIELLFCLKPTVLKRNREENIVTIHKTIQDCFFSSLYYVLRVTFSMAILSMQN